MSSNNQPLKFKSSNRPVRTTSQKQKQKPRQKPKRKSNRKGRVGGKPPVTIAPCTQGYGKTLTNPFDVHGYGLPCTPTVPSLKQSVFVKGTFNTGSNGFGFIMCQPLLGCVNDLNCVWSSTAATAITSALIADADTQAYRTNAAFSSAQISGEEDGMSYRCVSAGLRIRYTGTTLNQGGTVYGIHHPTHANLDDSTLAEIRALNVTKNFSVDRDWAAILWCPILSADYAYRTNTAGASPNMLFIISVPSATSLPFEFEMHANFEYVGAPVRGMTHSQADAVGFTATQSALQGSSMVVAPRGAAQNQQGLFQRIENGILTEASHVGSYVWDHKGELMTAALSML